MTIKPTENEQTSLEHLASHRVILTNLVSDFTRFGSIRLLVVGCYGYTQVVYAGFSKQNLEAMSVLAVKIAIDNMARELISPVSNWVKQAYDKKQTERLTDLHLIAFLCGVIPTLVTWGLNQGYVYTLSQDISQVWILPTSTILTSISLMVLTSENFYSSVRYPNPAMLFFAASGILLILSYMGLNKIDTSMTWLLVAQGIQCSSFVLACWAYMHKKYPDEHILSKLFTFRKWGAAFLEALKINKLGLLPAGIAMAEVSAGILTNRAMEVDNLSAYIQLSSTVIGIGNAISQTFQQRTQYHACQIQGELVGKPQLLRTAFRRLLFDSSALAIIPPVITGVVAWSASDLFIAMLYGTAEDKIAIAAEAKNNIALVFVFLIERFLASAPNGIIFSVRNSPEAFHQWVNNYSSLLRILTPLLIVSLGYALDKSMHLGSSSYWISGAILLGLADVINFGFVWKLIEHEYQRTMAQTSLTEESDVELLTLRVIEEEIIEEEVQEPPQNYNPAFFNTAGLSRGVALVANEENRLTV